MIRLCEDGKTLVSVGSWDEIFERPGFRRVVNEQNIHLKNILGYYSLPSKNPCGLKSCRTAHNRGYLVLLEGGYETNIGNICGKKHFNVDFDKSKARFTREVNAQRYRENINTKKSQLPRLKERLELLQKGENQANDCYRKMHTQMTRLFDEKTASAVRSMAKRRNGLVTREVKLTDEEKNFATGGFNKMFRTEDIFIIAGIQAASSFLKLAPKKLRELTAEMNTFENAVPASLDHNMLKWHNNWANTIDKKLNNLEGVIEDCKRFLLKQNIDSINAHKHYL